MLYFAQVLFHLLVLPTLWFSYCFVSLALRLYIHKKTPLICVKIIISPHRQTLCIVTGDKCTGWYRFPFYSRRGSVYRNSDCWPLPSARPDTGFSLLLIDGQVGSPVMKFESLFRSVGLRSACVCVCGVQFCPMAASKLSNWPFHSPPRTAPPPASLRLLPPPFSFSFMCPLVSLHYYFPPFSRKTRQCHFGGTFWNHLNQL